MLCHMAESCWQLFTVFLQTWTLTRSTIYLSAVISFCCEDVAYQIFSTLQCVNAVWGNGLTLSIV